MSDMNISVLMPDCKVVCIVAIVIAPLLPNKKAMTVKADTTPVVKEVVKR
jgi:hypothetical protein